MRNRPQVDEFGNPLEEIHSVDTTRFELGDGVDAREVRCPRNWHRFGESCYKFTRSPFKPWDRARGICQAFKHQDQVRIFLTSRSPTSTFCVIPHFFSADSLISSLKDFFGFCCRYYTELLLSLNSKVAATAAAKAVAAGATVAAGAAGATAKATEERRTPYILYNDPFRSS